MLSRTWALAIAACAVLAAGGWLLYGGAWAQPAASPNSRPEPIALDRPAALPWPSHGQAAVVIAGQTGTLRVYGKQRPVPVAGVTKVITALVILRAHPNSGDRDRLILGVALSHIRPGGSAAPS
ncbi:hypothetical protein AB0J63_42180 [Streptosporangium canum]|uniref:hypothetical protein n=1 Tax=Streptosporangium canum TaxID=324952 RepID=UPI0034313DFE